MSEEVKDARVSVPRALMASVAINGILGFGIVIAACFTMGSLQDIANIAAGKVSGIPLVDYFYFATGNKGFATGLTSLLISLFIFCAVAVLASASRVMWSFARDNGMPGSSWIKKGLCVSEMGM